MEQNKEDREKKLLDVVTKLLYLIICLMFMVGFLVYVSVCGLPFFLKFEDEKPLSEKDLVVQHDKVEVKDDVWTAPDISLISNEKNADQILYGKELIANTSKYFGPKGS